VTTLNSIVHVHLYFSQYNDTSAKMQSYIHESDVELPLATATFS